MSDNILGRWKFLTIIRIGELPEARKLSETSSISNLSIPMFYLIYLSLCSNRAALTVFHSWTPQASLSFLMIRNGKSRTEYRIKAPIYHRACSLLASMWDQRAIQMLGSWDTLLAGNCLAQLRFVEFVCIVCGQLRACRRASREHGRWCIGAFKHEYERGRPGPNEHASVDAVPRHVKCLRPFVARYRSRNENSCSVWTLFWGIRWASVRSPYYLDSIRKLSVHQKKFVLTYGARRKQKRAFFYTSFLALSGTGCWIQWPKQGFHTAYCLRCTKGFTVSRLPNGEM